MTSMLSPPDLGPPGAGDLASAPIGLPAHCTTIVAEDMRARLVAAADGDGPIEIDASSVESIGQATLQLLAAARAEAAAGGQGFAILTPSTAFVERVTSCRLADAVGLEIQKD